MNVPSDEADLLSNRTSLFSDRCFLVGFVGLLPREAGMSDRHSEDPKVVPERGEVLDVEIRILLAGKSYGRSHRVLKPYSRTGTPVALCQRLGTAPGCNST